VFEPIELGLAIVPTENSRTEPIPRIHSSNQITGARFEIVGSLMLLIILNEVGVCFMVFSLLVVVSLGDLEKSVLLHRGARSAT